LRWATTDRLTFTLREDYGDQHPMKYTGTPLVNGRLDLGLRHQNYNVGDAHIRYRDNRTTLQTDWTPSDSISLTNLGYVLTSKRQWRDLESYCWVGANGNCHNGYNYSPATPGNIYRTDNFGIGHDQTQWGDQGSATFKIPLSGNISTDLVVGFDVNSIALTYSNDFGSDVQEDSVTPTGFNPGLFYDTQGIAPRYRTQTTEYAFFAEDRLKFGDSSRSSPASGMRMTRSSAGPGPIPPAMAAWMRLCSTRN
jgi:iron complex outermembrane receptor protein